MTHPQVLLIGGSGLVGRRAARFLRDSHPSLPLLIGGRDRAKAQRVADDLGNAEGAALDLARDDLGLGDRAVSAVATLVHDPRTAGVRFAQGRGVPHLGISAGLHEIGRDVAVFMRDPGAAPVVLGAEWLVGATTVPTLRWAEQYRRLDSIEIVAVVDDDDAGGADSHADLDRIARTMPFALDRRGGAFEWRTGDDMSATVSAVDGTPLPAEGYSTFDILGLGAETNAATVRFDLASRASSSRRPGDAPATEIIVALAGEGLDGRPRRSRHAVVHRGGLMALTGIGVAAVLEALLGLSGADATAPGLYFPFQVMDADAYLARLVDSGGLLLDLDTV